MEHEFFKSKLKRSVDVSLVSDIIRSSSLGLDLHRTAAIELVLETSIEERRERMFTKAKNSIQPDPTPQSKWANEAPGTPTPQVQSPAPAPATQPPSQSLPDDTAGIVTGTASASTKYEGSQDPSPPSEPAKMIKKVAPRSEPPAGVETKPSPSEVFVELACCMCDVKQPRSGLRGDFRCSLCPGNFFGSWMKCVGCGTTRYPGVDACIICQGKFK
jgi:hypothetical protein